MGDLCKRKSLSGGEGKGNLFVLLGLGGGGGWYGLAAQARDDQIGHASKFQVQLLY